MTLKNAYSTAPAAVQAGDEFCFVVKLCIGYLDRKGHPMYRVYRCPFEGDEAPQGDRIDTDLEPAVMRALFPLIHWADGKQDL